MKLSEVIKQEIEKVKNEISLHQKLINDYMQLTHDQEELKTQLLDQLASMERVFHFALAEEFAGDGTNSGIVIPSNFKIDLKDEEEEDVPKKVTVKPKFEAYIIPATFADLRSMSKAEMYALIEGEDLEISKWGTMDEPKLRIAIAKELEIKIPANGE